MKTDRRASHQPPRIARLQRGVAAIEFGLIAMTFFLFLYGLLTFGALLYTQQTISRSAEDGARAVLALSSIAQSDIEGAVFESLESSLIFPPGSSASRAARLAWLKSAPVIVSVSGSVNATVTVSYPYGANPILAPLRLPFFESWFPDKLTGKAVVARST